MDLDLNPFRWNSSASDARYPDVVVYLSNSKLIAVVEVDKNTTSPHPVQRFVMWRLKADYWTFLFARGYANLGCYALCLDS